MKDFRWISFHSLKILPRKISHKGMVLITAMLIVVILFLLLYAFVSLNVTSLRAAVLTGEDVAAVQACNTGLEYARMRLESDATWGTFATGNFSLGKNACTGGCTAFKTSDTYQSGDGKLIVCENHLGGTSVSVTAFGKSYTVQPGEVEGWISPTGGSRNLRFKIEFGNKTTSPPTNTFDLDYSPKCYSFNNLTNINPIVPNPSCKHIPSTSAYLMVEGFVVDPIQRGGNVTRIVETLLGESESVDSSAYAGGNVVVAGNSASSTFFVNSASPFDNNVRAGITQGSSPTTPVNIYTPQVYVNGSTGSTTQWSFSTKITNPAWSTNLQGNMDTPATSNGIENNVKTGYVANSAVFCSACGSSWATNSITSNLSNATTQYDLQSTDQTSTGTSVQVDNVVSGTVTPNDPNFGSHQDPSTLLNSSSLGNTPGCYLPPGRYVFVDDHNVDYYSPGNTTTTPDNGVFGIALGGHIQDAIPLFNSAGSVSAIPGDGCSTVTKPAPTVDLQNFLFQVGTSVTVGAGVSGAPTTYTGPTGTSITPTANGFSLDTTPNNANTDQYPTLAVSYSGGGDDWGGGPPPPPGSGSAVTFSVVSGSANVNASCTACTYTSFGQSQSQYHGSIYVDGSLIGAGTVSAVDPSCDSTNTCTSANYGQASFSGQSSLSTNATGGVAVYADGDVTFNPLHSPGIGQYDMRAFASAMGQCSGCSAGGYSGGWGEFDNWGGMSGSKQGTDSTTLASADSTSIGTFNYDPTTNQFTYSLSAVGTPSGQNTTSFSSGGVGGTYALGGQLMTYGGAAGANNTFASTGTGSTVALCASACSGNLSLGLLLRVEQSVENNQSQWLDPSKKNDNKDVSGVIQNAINGYSGNDNNLSNQISNQMNDDLTVQMQEYMLGSTLQNKTDNNGYTVNQTSYNSAYSANWTVDAPVNNNPDDQKFQGIIYSKTGSIKANPGGYQFSIDGALVAKGDVAIYNANTTVFNYDPKYLSVFNSSIGGLTQLQIYLWDILK